MEVKYQTVKNFVSNTKDEYEIPAKEINPATSEDLIDDILNYHRLYIQLVSNIRLFNQTNDPILLTTFFAVIFFVSTDAYLFVICIIEGREWYHLYIAILNGLCMILFPIFFIACCENLISKVSFSCCDAAIHYCCACSCLGHVLVISCHVLDEQDI